MRELTDFFGWSFCIRTSDHPSGKTLSGMAGSALMVAFKRVFVFFEKSMPELAAVC